jgi:hypothetical protein
MLTFAKLIEDISESDLQRLVEATIPESRTIDFKAELPGRTSGDHKEFLRDVVAFSNGLGGHIVYGIEENNGVAANLRGLVAENIDAEILRLEQIVRTGIDPIIHGLRIRSVPLPTHGGNAVVIEIPAGLFGPHMIRNRGAFVTRTSAGKMDMDFGEIRAAFVGAETVIEKLNEFRQERTGRLISGETIVPVTKPAMLAIHILPLVSFAPAFRCDLTRLSQNLPTRELIIPRQRTLGWQPRFTHQGFVQTCTAGPTPAISPIYANVFRNGAIEVADCDVATISGPEILTAIHVEMALLETVANLLRALRALEIQPPFYVLPSVLNMRGYKLRQLGYQGDPNVDRPLSVEHLILPEAVVDDYEGATLDQLFRPIFDVLWNAAGWSGSPNYNTDGTYQIRWRDRLQR